MLSLSRKDRCKNCHTERALRLCPRKNKGLCWKCCNELRIDLNCPESCPYAPKLEKESLFPSFKADNNHEAVQAIRYYIDIWINKPSKAFQDLSPKELADKDQTAVLELLSDYQYPGNFPVDYLMQKLGLAYETEAEVHSAEDIAAQYLDLIIALDFDKLRELTLNQAQIKELDTRYARLIQAIPFYKKLRHYSFIHSGLSEDGAQSIVFVEFNYRTEYCFILRNVDKTWYMRQSINGNPGLYFKQNELYQKIASLLGQGKDESAYNEISEALRSFPDSADLYYYKALYWLLVKQNAKAKEDFLNSIALDNTFTPPYMHLGLQYLNEKDYKEAKLWFAALVQLEPDNADAINNLAIAHLADGDKAHALRLWQEILKKFPGHEMAKKNLELYG